MSCKKSLPAAAPACYSSRPEACLAMQSPRRGPQAMTITIHIPSPLRPCCAGASELSLSAPSVRAALEQIERSHPALYRSVCDETGAVRRHVNLFVNTSHVRDRDGLDTALVSGARIT